MEEPSDNSGFLGDKFDDFEFQPRDQVWDRVQQDVGSDSRAGFLATTLGALAHRPRPAVWRKIVRELHPQVARRRAFVWWSAAASVAVLITWAAFNYTSGGTAPAATRLAGQTEEIVPVAPRVDERRTSPMEEVPATEGQENLAATESVDTPLNKCIPPTTPNSTFPIANNFTPDPQPEKNTSPAPQLRERRAVDGLTARSVDAWAAAELPMRVEEETQLAPVMIEIPLAPGEEPEGSDRGYSALLASSVTSSSPFGTLALGGLRDFESFTQDDLTSGGISQSEGFLNAAYPRTREEYETPIIVGGKFRTRWSRRWSSDWGVNYTHMGSMLRRSSTSENIESNSVRRYLGPSAEIVLDLMPDRKVNLYLSSGLKYDIGLGTWVTETFNSNTPGTTAESVRSRLGSQLSGLGGMGLDIGLTPQLSLFGQTNINYMLRDRSFNLWSFRKYYPSVQAGLRFELK